MRNRNKLYLYAFVLSIGYGTIVVFASFIRKETNLVDIVTACKIASLITLLVVNGDIAQDIDKRQPHIKIINYLILAISTLLTVIIGIKFLGLNPNESKMSSQFQNFIAYLYKNVYWISAFPLLAYGILDFYIAYRSKSTDREKAIAIKFIVFVDLVCVFPLVLIYLLTYLFGSDDKGIELFISGSMAIVLLASAIAAKAVDVYFSDQPNPQ